MDYHRMTLIGNIGNESGPYVLRLKLVGNNGVIHEMRIVPPQNMNNPHYIASVIDDMTDIAAQMGCTELGIDISYFYKMDGTA